MPFYTAVDSLFRSVLAVDATYTPSGGDPAAVRAVTRTPAQDLAAQVTGINRPAYAADIRVSEVTQPVEGDVLTIGSDSFRVRRYSYDSHKLVWQLDLDKI